MDLTYINEKDCKHKYDSLITNEIALDFKAIELDSLIEINKYLKHQPYRTCDFTIGGLCMWATYFKYEYTIYEKTLFIKGVSETNLSTVAFSVPIGQFDINESIRILDNYCKRKNLKFILSAVPETLIENITLKPNYKITKLENWSDYLYDIKKISELTGKPYNKKRNHINKFLKCYPSYTYERIDTSNISLVRSFFYTFKEQQQKDDAIFTNELVQTEFILNNFNFFTSFFVGGLIKINNYVVAFTIGEIINDTLYVHIEKADIEYHGIYEMINMKFASDIMASNPTLKYVNREEDVGDEGLRKSKLSYHPIMLLNKYNIEVND